MIEMLGRRVSHNQGSVKIVREMMMEVSGEERESEIWKLCAIFRR